MTSSCKMTVFGTFYVFGIVLSEKFELGNHLTPEFNIYHFTQVVLHFYANTNTDMDTDAGVFNTVHKLLF